MSKRNQWTKGSNKFKLETTTAHLSQCHTYALYVSNNNDGESLRDIRQNQIRVSRRQPYTKRSDKIQTRHHNSRSFTVSNLRAARFQKQWWWIIPRHEIKPNKGEQAPIIQKRLGQNSNSTPQLQMFHRIILTFCTFPTTMRVNHSEIFNKISKGEQAPQLCTKGWDTIHLDTTTAHLSQCHTYAL